jgi:T5SS/PEP-CTERM-associated repeat protein
VLSATTAPASARRRYRGTGASWTNSGNLTVGQSGQGALNVESGGAVSDASGIIGNSSTGIGTATVSGRGSRWTSNNFFVGNAGTGTAECRERRRGQRRERRYRQQQHRHRHGDGVGERFELDEQRTLTVGSTGHGTLNIESGGTVSTGTSGILSIASASGSAGTVNIGAPAGSAALAPGILSTNSVQFGAGTGTLNFNYTSDGYVFSPAISGSGTINVLAGMTLFHANDGGFTGTTNISGGALQIGDA